MVETEDSVEALQNTFSQKSHVPKKLRPRQVF